MSLKKELNSDTWHDMDEPWRHCATEHKPAQNDKHCMIPLTWSTKVLKFTERRSRMVLGAGRGVGELVYNGCRGSVWEKEKVPEMNKGDGYTTMWV